ncbi:MAG TPA: cobyric acid synthase, partial [Clostridia bacterium]|nr:cobyric acid synthase [Clostridia bacterium]
DFSPISKTKDAFDGLADEDFKVAGTYIHNIFHNDGFRNSWLNLIRKKKGYALKEPVNTNALKEQDYEKLADYAKKYLDIDYIKKIMRGEV